VIVLCVVLSTVALSNAVDRVLIRHGRVVDPSDDSETLAHQVVAGGETTGEEHLPDEDLDTLTTRGESVSEDIAEALKKEGVKGNRSFSKASLIARIPHLIALVKAHKYKEATQYIDDTLGYSDVIEVLKIVAEHVGAEKVAGIATVASDVAETGSLVLQGLQFQYEGLKALAEAHERGERDDRIELYAEAWSSGFLEGTYTNDGIVNDGQRKAAADGLREGKASAGALGLRAADVGKQLLQQYGKEDNARHALIDELLSRAGIEGIKTHEGK